MLKYADIRAAIEQHTDALVDAMGIPEILTLSRRSRHAAATRTRLLKYADIRAAIEQHTDALVDAMGIPEILKRLKELRRADPSNFMQKVTPEMAQQAIEACGSDEDKARYALAVLEGRGRGLTCNWTHT